MPNFVVEYNYVQSGSFVVEADDQESAYDAVDNAFDEIDFETFIDGWGEVTDFGVSPYSGNRKPDFDYSTPPDPAIKGLQKESLFDLIETNV